MTRQRALFLGLLMGATAAAVGCQVVSGASSLDIVDDAGTLADTGGGNTPDASDDAIRPPGDGSPELDATAEADAPFVACTVPEGGAYTTCAPGGVAGIATCVQYCAAMGKCCAEDCTPYSTDTSLTAAQFNAASESVCVDPLSGSTGSATFVACSNSAIPAKERYFKCCCR